MQVPDQSPPSIFHSQYLVRVVLEVVFVGGCTISAESRSIWLIGRGSISEQHVDPSIRLKDFISERITWTSLRPERFAIR